MLPIAILTVVSGSVASAGFVYAEVMCEGNDIDFIRYELYVSVKPHGIDSARMAAARSG